MAVFTPGDTVDARLKHADDALYHAKRSGREGGSFLTAADKALAARNTTRGQSLIRYSFSKFLRTQDMAAATVGKPMVEVRPMRAW